MKTIPVREAFITLGVVSACLLGGCAGMTSRERATATGAAVGGVAGAVLGGSTAATVGGAAVGAVVGNQIEKKK